MLSDGQRQLTKSRTLAVRIGGTLLFVALLVWLDSRGALPLQDVANALGSANPLLVALSICLYVPFLLVKSERWRLLSTCMLMPVARADAWRIYAIGLAAGTFTPGQAGDTLKAWYLQRAGYPLGRAIGSSVLDRLFDVAALAALGLVGVAVFGRQFAAQTPVLIGWVVLGLLTVAFFAFEKTRIWFISVLRRRLGRSDAGTQDGARWSLSGSAIAQASALTVASFATSIFRVWLLAAALGIWLGPLEVSGFVGLTTAAALVPVTVGGVGTRDVVAALAFSQLGRAPAEGVAVSLLILLLNVAQAIAGWLVWLRYRPQSEALQVADQV